MAMVVALGFPPFGLWPLTFVAFFLGFRLLMARAPDRRANAEFLAAYSFFVNLFGFYWLAYTLREFGSIPWIISVPLMFIIFGVFAVFSGLVGYAWGRWSVRIPAPGRPAALIFVIMLWDALDPRLFPWSPVMSVGQNSLLLASAHTLGTWGWRVIFFGTAGALAALSLQPPTWSWRDKPSRPWFLAMAGVLAVALGFVFGVGSMDRGYLMKRFSERQPVALLQGNVGNYEKKLTKLGVMPTIDRVLSIHRDLVEQAAIKLAPRALDEKKPLEPWILWPETSFPGYAIDGAANQALLEDWTHLTRGLHLVGAYEVDTVPFGGEQKRLDYNVVALFQESKGFVDRYRKNRRLMFGEYIPGDTWFPWLYKVLPAVNHFGGGTEKTALAHPDSSGPVFIPLVCYEILFEGFTDDFVSRAKKAYPGRPLVLVNPSNDSWYGPTSEPFQNALLARWAAVRQGLPLLRPTNTGLSLVVAPWGEVVAQGTRDDIQVIFGELPVMYAQKRSGADVAVPRTEPLPEPKRSKKR